MSKNKKLLIAIALMSIMLIAMIVGIMVVLVAGNQNAKVQLKVKYQVSDVYVEISAKAYIGSNVYTLKNGNSDILTLSPVNMNGELNQTEEELVMDRDNSKIIYEYKFTNLSETIPASISQTIDDGGVKVPVDTINNNILLTYSSSTAQKYNTITSNKNTLNSQSLLPKTTKYIYVIATIQDLMKDVLFEGEFGWTLTKADLVDNTTENVSGGTIISGTEDNDVVNKDEIDKVNLVLDCENEKPNSYPQKANKCFTGWYTKDESGNDIEVEWPALITSSTKIYPKYEDETPGLSYTYTGDGYAIVGGYNGSTADIFVPDIHNDGTNGNAKITSIAAFAFQGNKTIKNLFVPNSVKIIGRNAFSNSLIETVNIPASVTTINDRVFQHCSSIVKMTVDVDNPVYDSRDNSNAIIETQINELKYGCNNTIIPHSVTSIGEYAFYGNSALTNIDISSNISVVKQQAFALSGLSSLNIVEGVKEIQNQAFYACHQLAKIVVPSSVINLHELAIANCNNLTDISVATGNPIYDSRSNCNAVIESATNTLVTGCKNTIIPDSVTALGDQAFYNCRKLVNIYITKNIKSIGKNVYSGCTKVESVVIDSANTKYDSRNDCNAIIESATDTLLFGCSTTIIPNTVKTIASFAFSMVNDLTTITIPASVNNIELQAFMQCSSLESIVVDSNNTTYDSRNNCNAIIETATNKLIVGCKNTVIPNTVKEIGDHSFNRVYFSSITIPSGVVKLGKDCFANCKLLTSVTIPNTVTTIDSRCFVGTSITSIVIPASVTFIGYTCFSDCDSLDSVKFSDTTGWKAYSSEPATTGEDIVVSPTDYYYNSTLLKAVYSVKYWRKEN